MAPGNRWVWITGFVRQDSLAAPVFTRTEGHPILLLSCYWPKPKNAQGFGDGDPKSIADSATPYAIRDRDK